MSLKRARELDLALSVSVSASASAASSPASSPTPIHRSREDGAETQSLLVRSDSPARDDADADADEMLDLTPLLERASKRARLTSPVSPAAASELEAATQPLSASLSASASFSASAPWSASSGGSDVLDVWALVQGVRFLHDVVADNAHVTARFLPLVAAMPPAVRTYLHALASQRGHVHALPAELLVAVFAPLLDEHVFTLLQVCRHWQDVLATHTRVLPRRVLRSPSLGYLAYFPLVRTLRPLALLPDVAALAHLSHARALTSLDLAHTLIASSRKVFRVTDAGAHALTACVALRSLRLCVAAGVGTGLGTALSALTTLTQLRLDLSASSVAELDVFLPALASLAQLRELVLCGAVALGSHLSHLLACPVLASLSVRESGLTDSDASVLPRLRALRELDVRDCAALKLSTQWLRKCTQLTALRLSNVSDKKLIAHVALLPALTSLSVQGARALTGAGLAASLKYLGALTSLSLHGCTALASIEWAHSTPHLTVLDVARTALVSAQLLRLVRTLPALTRLTVPAPSHVDALRVALGDARELDIRM